MQGAELPLQPVPANSNPQARRHGMAKAYAAVLLVAMTLVACDSGTEQNHSTAPGDTAGKLETAVVEKWADHTFGRMIAEHRVSGLAVSVTHGNDVIFKKGYGYADWANKVPVNADTSVFRIASLTKTFFGTAIAQLLERGQIESLDDPVNKYLKRVQLENPFGGEITIWDLLTHQGGLGRAQVRYDGTGPHPDPPLPAEYIAEHTPPVVREPGTISIYCNPCSATLGFMVEDITGMTLQEYLNENIFQPLGMTHTELTNAPEAPSPAVVTQYAFVPNGPPVALPYPPLTPYISYAGDTNSTAGDMANWLIAHTMEGEGTGPAILKPETFKLMHARKRGNHPDASGFGMQFFVYDYNGETVIEHYGSLNFRSMEFMMLDSKIGVFVTMAGGGEPSETEMAHVNNSLEPISGQVLPEVSHSGVRAVVLEHFLGKLPIPANVAADTSKYVGVYHNVPVDPNSEPSGQGRLVEATEDGGLIIGGVGVYRPSAPDTFALDKQLPLEAGFRENNKYVFAVGPSGAMRMYPHINAGAMERAE